MALFDPRKDERPPTYFKGQWFGGVPHTRVVLVWPDAYGDYAMFAGGVVIESAAYSDDDPNFAIGQWLGFLALHSTVYAVEYSWQCVDKGGGEAVTRIALTDVYTTLRWEGYRTYVPFRPADRIPTVNGLPSYEAQLGPRCTKYDVPEWSDVVSRWPDALAAGPEFPTA